jgi:uncharacterized heparinase superfamily protein
VCSDLKTASSFTRCSTGSDPGETEEEAERTSKVCPQVDKKVLGSHLHITHSSQGLQLLFDLLPHLPEGFVVRAAGHVLNINYSE